MNTINIVNNIVTLIEACIYALVIYLYLLFMGILAIGNVILYIIFRGGKDKCV